MRHIYLSERLESDNEEIYNVMDSVNAAVNLNRQITFSFEDIGRDEGVGASAIKRNIEIAFRKLKPYSDFLQNVPAAKLVNLL